jgi:xanthine dehydrogenase iron-sulfur cluster and FAD-binding subunit A
MEFFRPRGLDEALAAKAAHPDAVPIAGGTDVMVELNFARRRPPALLDLSDVTELAGWSVVGDRLRVGAGVTYAELTGERLNGSGGELGRRLRGLAIAARTVGSPQIRNRGTIGGNLGSASPAGDCHPSLLAAGAEVEVVSVRGARQIAIDEFFTGVKRNALAPDELVSAVWISQPTGPEQFAKIGTRNAMVIAVAAFGLALHPHRGAVGTGIGSAAPTPVRASDAEAFLAGTLAEAGLWETRGPLPAMVVAEFGSLVSAAARPIDDVRGTAAYRRHSRGAGQADADLGVAGVQRRPGRGEWAMRVTATVNGVRQQADDVWPGESLLFVLRERMGLPGSKNACEQGECGSCTVYLDGVPVCACLVAAGQADGHEIVTVEGLADADRGLHPVQEAFIEAGAVQCGFCTPGLLVAAHDLLARQPDPADADIREALAGNLCRCTGYEKILDAVRLAAARLRASA